MPALASCDCSPFDFGASLAAFGLHPHATHEMLSATTASTMIALDLACTGSVRRASTLSFIVPPLCRETGTPRNPPFPLCGAARLGVQPAGAFAPFLPAVLPKGPILDG